MISLGSFGSLDPVQGANKRHDAKAKARTRDGGVTRNISPPGLFIKHNFLLDYMHRNMNKTGENVKKYVILPRNG